MFANGQRPAANGANPGTPFVRPVELFERDGDEQVEVCRVALWVRRPVDSFSLPTSTSSYEGEKGIGIGGSAKDRWKKPQMGCGGICQAQVWRPVPVSPLGPGR